MRKLRVRAAKVREMFITKGIAVQAKASRIRGWIKRNRSWLDERPMEEKENIIHAAIVALSKPVSRKDDQN